MNKQHNFETDKIISVVIKMLSVLKKKPTFFFVADMELIIVGH